MKINAVVSIWFVNLIMIIWCGCCRWSLVVSPLSLYASKAVVFWSRLFWTFTLDYFSQIKRRVLYVLCKVQHLHTMDTTVDVTSHHSLNNQQTRKRRFDSFVRLFILHFLLQSCNHTHNRRRRRHFFLFSSKYPRRNRHNNQIIIIIFYNIQHKT